MSDKQVSVSRVIPHPPEAIFDLLADPDGHVRIDGSGTVQSVSKNPGRLGQGAKFKMAMKMGPLPYKVTSQVKEFEENRRIAWAHFGGHRWRYELEPVDGGTEVTETFDWSTANAPTRMFIEQQKYPEKHPAGMAKTLERIEEILDAG